MLNREKDGLGDANHSEMWYYFPPTSMWAFVKKSYDVRNSFDFKSKNRAELNTVCLA